MVTYRITVPYRGVDTRLYEVGEVLTDAELGGRGEHLVNIKRAVRVSAPDETAVDDPEDDGVEITGNTVVNSTGEIDIDAVASAGIPDFDTMNKTQIVAWAEEQGISVSKRDRVDDIISTIMQALEG